MELPLLLLAALLGAATAQTCDSTLNTSPKGLNPACPRSTPYCIAGGCQVCNPYALDDYVCDCPAGKGCSRDFINLGGNPGTCVVMPKYGQACGQASDCLTTYFGAAAYNVQLVCVAGACRYCDPAVNGTGNSTVLCPSDVSQAGQLRNCIAPGIWGVPAPASPATVATASATTTRAAATTTTSAAIAAMPTPPILLLAAIAALLAAHV